MNRSTVLVVLSLATAAVLSLRASADDWPRWRGPGGRGVSEDGPLPERWSSKTGENIAWKRDALPGWGDSSPVVVGERIYLTSQSEDDTIHVLAIARSDGRVIWDRAVGKKRLKAHDLHNMATPSCVADGEHVWALFGTGDLVCLDARGKPIWKRELTADHGRYEILWGSGALKWRKRTFRGDVKASPIAGDGKIYFWSRDGACAVLRAGPDGTVISENDGDGQLIATPAIADGQIFVRTKSSLYAVGSGHPGKTDER